MVDNFRTPKRPTPKRPEKPVDDEGPSFVPPEVIAASEPDTPTKSAFAKTDLPKNAKRRHRLLKWWRRQERWQKIVIVGVVLMFLTTGVLITYARTRPGPPFIADPQKAEPPKPTTEPSRLTGVQVDPELNKLPVTGVIIENSPDARPQSGLYDAGVVFEAIAEGGITRFLALYQEAKPKEVGPVRSLRPYYLSWALGFDAPIAHVGGSPDALRDVRTLKGKSLNQFYNAGAYERKSSRFAPHNVYTSLDKLLGLEKSKGWTGSDFTGFLRKEEKPRDTPRASTVSIKISDPLYNVRYTYDKKSNGYRRNMAGAKHKDAKNGKHITPKVVIVLVTSQGLHSDGLHTKYKTVGGGQVYVFQDGNVVKGTWKKKSHTSQITFENAEGAPLELNPGQTWITVVGSSGAVSFQP